MKEAVAAVLKGQTVYSIAKETGINAMTLKRYVRKTKLNPGTICRPKQVFTNVQRRKHSCWLSPESSKTSLRVFDEDIQKNWKMNLPFPCRKICLNHGIIQNVLAQIWLQVFMSRQNELSLRSPEVTSLARATVFNKPTEFFNNLRKVRTCHNYAA